MKSYFSVYVFDISFYTNVRTTTYTFVLIQYKSIVILSAFNVILAVLSVLNSLKEFTLHLFMINVYECHKLEKLVNNEWEYVFRGNTFVTLKKKNNKIKRQQRWFLFILMNIQLN